MSAHFAGATTAVLIDEYLQAYKLPAALIHHAREYMSDSSQREEWPVRYVDFCTRRYASRRLAGRRALDAGCGSGGSLVHLAARFEHVVGQDSDLPSLLIALKRCQELGIAHRVTLVASRLEERAFPSGTFDAIKCTDVLEHVDDPTLVCRRMAEGLIESGVLFVLTPNRWSLTTPEPHVRLWGVGFLPGRLADWYVTRRLGFPYRNVARLISYRRFRRILEGTGLAVTIIPVEDKHLNPDSWRGKVFKRAFSHGPLEWLSWTVRPVQRTLEALCVKRGT
jgi:SAM-dependent methyltransferase